MEQQKTSSRSGVSPRLTKGMTPEEIETFEGSYKRATKVLATINEYAAKEVREKGLAIDNPAGFENPNWSHLVAWWAGYRQAMRITEQITRK